MKIDVAGEVAACLKSAPVGDCTADQVKAWLFTDRSPVAVRLRRILEDKAEDKAARDLLTEAAARTWRLVNDPEGKAQRLWARMSAGLVPLAKNKAKALQEKVNVVHPRGLLASIFPQTFTYRDAASSCASRCAGPLARKMDLISPCGGYMRDVADEAVRRWAAARHRKDCAVPMPVLGNFLAPLVLHRLGMMIDVLLYLRWVLEGRPEAVSEKLKALDRAIQDDALALRDEIWDSPDAQGCAGAMALPQTYLALETRQPGFLADWSVVPWRGPTDRLALTILDRQKDEALFPTREDRQKSGRGYVLAYTFQEALEKRPIAMVSIVKSGLEWLESSLAAHHKAKKKMGQPKETVVPKAIARPPIPKVVMERLREIPAKTEESRKSKVLAWEYRKRSSEEIARHITKETGHKIGPSRARQLRGEAAKWVYEGTRETLTPKQTAIVLKILNRLRKVYRPFGRSFWDESEEAVKMEITAELLCSGEKEAEAGAKKLLDDKRRDLRHTDYSINPDTGKPYEELTGESAT